MSITVSAEITTGTERPAGDQIMHMGFPDCSSTAAPGHLAPGHLAPGHLAPGHLVEFRRLMLHRQGRLPCGRHQSIQHMEYHFSPFGWHSMS